MAENFDLVVIGSGSAASTVASRCRKAGWQVAIVDSRPCSRGVSVGDGRRDR